MWGLGCVKRQNRGKCRQIVGSGILSTPPPLPLNMAHIRQSGPDSGLDCQVKVLSGESPQNLVSCSLFAWRRKKKKKRETKKKVLRPGDVLANKPVTAN